MLDEKIRQITDPAQLRSLSIEELAELAPELRQLIIRTVSKNGGHFASNLGSVELTLALVHRFDPFVDRVVWDVGHQSYSWKILTGRYEAFKTLRQEDGLSGFPKREESLADAFNTGHSSTSISAALGIARAMKLKGEAGRAIAVIGDGALTGGQAYEALNNINEDDQLIVIINDNQMSIDTNVGSVAQHLNRIRVNSRYLKAKSGIEKILSRIPLLGESSVRLIRYLKSGLRRATARDQSFFEALGLKYYGPIDGHDLVELDRHLALATQIDGPVVLHVLTQKGRGYDDAEVRPSIYHGVAPFEIDLGVEEKKAEPGVLPFLGNCRSFTAAFSQSILKLAEENPEVVAITAAMAQGTGLSDFQKAYPERFFDVGIAEQHAITMACGMATRGLKPVVALYASFLQRALDQVLHDAVLQQLQIVICVDRAGIVGDDGETHQGLYDLSFLAALPGITILEPSDYRSVYDMLSFALLHCTGPVVIRYPRGGQSLDSKLLLRPQLRTPLPKPELLQEGRDCCIVASGNMTGLALAAAKQLNELNIHTSVIDLRCLKPLDSTFILNHARASALLVTVEEHVMNGGLAHNLALEIAQNGDGIRLLPLAVGDYPILQAKQERALAKEGLSVEAIVTQVSRLFEEEKQSFYSK